MVAALSGIPSRLRKMAGSKVDDCSSMCARNAPSKVLGDAGMLPPGSEASMSEDEYGIALKVRYSACMLPSSWAIEDGRMPTSFIAADLASWVREDRLVC
jgi:hypothetical protein